MVSRETTLRYYDGSEKNREYNDIETQVPVGKLIVSRTDTAGFITHMNKAFIELSGYSQQELLGQPHCILRHPDMPKSVFKDAWDTVIAGNKWHGFVKNLRKDGGFYWVNATIIPNIRHGKMIGVSSVRRKPSKAAILATEKHYQQLLKDEQS